LQLKELEDKLAELHGLHSDLARSYETLHIKYSIAKSELEALQRENCKHESEARTSRDNAPGVDESDELRAVASYPLLVGLSGLSYDEELFDKGKGWLPG
jgi:hypothetical protein